MPCYSVFSSIQQNQSSYCFQPWSKSYPLKTMLIWSSDQSNHTVSHLFQLHSKYYHVFILCKVLKSSRPLQFWPQHQGVWGLSDHNVTTIVVAFIHKIFPLSRIVMKPWLRPQFKIIVEGPMIVGAGPSGLAAATCLKQKGIRSLILERDDCLASMWQLKTYDRLCLHLPKQFCQLPLMPFPQNFPSYPTKQQFLAYLKAYADHFT